jgi:CBS-domain-containing membrane protein
MNFFDKIKGVSQSPPPVSSIEICLSWLGTFLGVGLVGLVNNLIVGAEENVLMITAFGASAVLLYGAPKSPLAQPRNLVGGHLLAAFIGVAIYKVFFFQLWFASALTVAIAVAVI